MYKNTLIPEINCEFFLFLYHLKQYLKEKDIRNSLQKNKKNVK